MSEVSAPPPLTSAWKTEWKGDPTAWLQVELEHCRNKPGLQKRTNNHPQRWLESMLNLQGTNMNNISKGVSIYMYAVYTN